MEVIFSAALIREANKVHNSENEQIKEPEIDGEILPTWKFFVDGSSNEHNSGARLILITLEGHCIHYALRFGFNASNNEAEYEALLAGLQLARDVRAISIDIYSDSQLVVNKNSNDDALAKLSIAKDVNTLNVIPVENLAQHSINESKKMLLLNKTPFWMTPIATYLEKRMLPEDINEARNCLRQAASYVIIDGVMYKRGYSMPLL
ncbi:uncharacterized protein LOC133825247 [Humulus lupulus]|uniref:uncharacterized protein LOC133825247 n=1 Tax=Humulus lupulus TaxID=3486 RepID=UPI002B40D268|nr:uncharacterized protein LOC133825247 [Humulus lupulus]